MFEYSESSYYMTIPKKKQAKVKTKEFEGYLTLTLNEIMSLGSSDKKIGDLFLEKIMPNKIWHLNAFDYYLIGANIDGELVFFVSGTLADSTPTKKPKISTKKSPVVAKPPIKTKKPVADPVSVKNGQPKKKKGK